MGLSDETFSELILVLKIGSCIHVQPLGVKYDGVFLKSRVFKSTKLHDIMKVGLKGSLNIIYDIRAYFEPILYGKLKTLKIVGGIPYIASSNAVIFIKVEKVMSNGDYSWVYFKPLSINIIDTVPKAPNRVFPALIEALIHLTRVKYYTSIGELEEALKFREKIKFCLEILSHATENKFYINIGEEILSTVEKIIRGLR